MGLTFVIYNIRVLHDYSAQIDIKNVFSATIFEPFLGATIRVYGHLCGCVEAAEAGLSDKPIMSHIPPVR